MPHKDIILRRKTQGAYERRRYRENALVRHKKRNESLLNRHGITLEEKAQRIAAQGGACAICKSTVPGGTGTFHTDHDHTTGALRDELCSGCNLGLGHFKDSAEFLRAAATYIDMHKAKQ